MLWRTFILKGALLSALALQGIIDPEKLYTSFRLICSTMELMSKSLQQTFVCFQIKIFKIKRGKNFAMTLVDINKNFCNEILLIF